MKPFTKVARAALFLTFVDGAPMYSMKIKTNTGLDAVLHLADGEPKIVDEDRYVNKNVLVLVSPTFQFPEFVQAKGGNPEDLVSAKTEIPTAIGGVRTNRFRPLHLSRLRRFPRTGRRAGTRQCETEIYPETAAWWHALVWTLYAIEALPSKLNSGLYELADALALAITAMIARYHSTVPGRRLILILIFGIIGGRKVTLAIVDSKERHL
jgi:hypothetical protein